MRWDGNRKARQINWLCRLVIIPPFQGEANEAREAAMERRTPLPIVIPHAPEDHRWVDVSELTSLKLYHSIMGPRPLSSILDFAMANPGQFLRSTSKWNENHLTAFRCLLLENLEPSRIVPLKDLPGDSDQAMKMVAQHLSAPETDIRSENTAATFGPAVLFYQQLKVVLRRPPTPPSPIPIPIPRTFRTTTSNPTNFPSIPESGSLTSDSSYQPSPDARNPDPSTTRPVVSEGGTRPRTSMESVLSDSAMSISSTEEDKIESVANQAAISLLGLLCTFEAMTHPDRQRKLFIRFSLSFPPLPPGRL